MNRFRLLLGHLRATWHLLRDHNIVTLSIGGRVRSIYCDDCHCFLWRHP